MSQGQPPWRLGTTPDGTEIAFRSDRTGNPEIFVMNADGSNVRQLTNDPSVDSHPEYSPDGTKIVFDSFRSGGPAIHVMIADGSNVQQLTVLISAR